jgi:hypothetical protein
LDFLILQMDKRLICINVFFFKSYYSHNLSKFSYTNILEILKTQLFLNILLIRFSYIKILDTLCVTYHKFNGVHLCFIMKVKEVLNKVFHVYTINVIVIRCGTTFLTYFTMLSPKKDFYTTSNHYWIFSIL